MNARAGAFSLLVAASSLALIGPAAALTRLSFHAGTEYSSGEYGGVETTEIIAVPFGVRLTVDDWTFRASSSYLHVSGPADISEDGETNVGPGVVVRAGAEKGFGDTTVSIERAFRRIGGSPLYAEFTARARLPTAKEGRGLGVGATDYGVVSEVGFSTRSGGAFVSAGYRFLGQPDNGPERHDGIQAGLGAWLPVGNRMRVGAFGAWREASTNGADDPATAGAYVSYRMSQRMRVTFTGAAGLSDASPDAIASIRFNWLPGGQD